MKTGDIMKVAGDKISERVKVTNALAMVTFIWVTTLMAK
jgi:hypothetical protein